MANKTIPELTASSTILPTHVIPFDTGTQTFKATVADLAETFANLERDRGLPAWNSGITYGVGTIVRDATNQNGFLYVSMASSNLNHALTDTAWWRKITTAVTATVTGNTTLGADHIDAFIPCDSTSAAFNITLFTGGAPKHTRFTIKDTKGTFGTNPVTIVRVGSEKIDNTAANFVCNREYGVYTFITNGTDWFIENQTPGFEPTGSFWHRSSATVLGKFVKSGAAASAIVSFYKGTTLQFHIGFDATGGDIVNGTSANDIIFRNVISSGGISFGGGASNLTLFRINSDGAINAPYIHNATSGNIKSGRYSPSPQNLENCTSITLSSAHYTVVGKTVTVSGQGTCGTTAAGNTHSRMRLTVPIASTLSAAGDAAGGGARPSVTGTAGMAIQCYADTSANQVILAFNSTDTQVLQFSYTFQYELK